MVSVISIVNSEYSNPELNIKCAKQDGERILETFRHILKEEYDLCGSGCFENIKSYQLKDFLEILLKTQRKDNIVIIYFGCHGEVDGEEFYLLLSDATKKGKEGFFLASDLYQLCHNYSDIKFLLIFDCCYSGCALYLANKKYKEVDSNITVISSSSHYERAKFTETGSEFTISLCNALRNLDGQEENITVSNIVSQIKKNRVKCFVNISEGNVDFVILSKRKQFMIYNENFVNTYIERLDNCVAVREMMWYSINDIPNSVKKKIFKKYLEMDCSEASWLVRRAMGNTLSSLDDDRKVNNDIVYEFLKSFNWMNKCIGIVAISKSLSEDRAQYLKSILSDKNSNIDLVWLADLYLSDSDYHDINVTLETKLSKSVWGLIEIWDRYVGKYEEQDELFNIIRNHVHDKEIIDGLSREIELRKNTEKGSLANFLYSGKSRGRTVDLKQKWLLSLLYGNWRGRVESDLKEYFLNTNKATIIKELENAKNIPSVERRVSLFEYFENEQEYLKKYKEYIKWGLQDEHPWVRRIAILCFKNYPKEIQVAFRDIIKTDIYSETFAMIINAASITLDNYRDYIERYDWTDCERNAILKAVFRENKRKYM